MRECVRENERENVREKMCLCVRERERNGYCVRENVRGREMVLTKSKHHKV